MKPKFRKALAALLAVICALCLGRTALQLVQYRQGDETYAQAEELAGLPDLSDLPVVDFTGGSGSVSSSASTDGAFVRRTSPINTVGSARTRSGSG